MCGAACEGTHTYPTEHDTGVGRCGDVSGGGGRGDGRRKAQEETLGELVITESQLSWCEMLQSTALGETWICYEF